jgi:hypothetical protein
MPDELVATNSMNREIIRRRHLPHWDVPDAAYFVTFCLQGSIPHEGFADLREYLVKLNDRETPPGKTTEEWQRDKWKLHLARVESWLDTKPANRALADESLAAAVADSMFHFAGTRYDVIAFVVMPSHVHWLFQPTKEWVATLPDGVPTPRVSARPSATAFWESAAGHSGKPSPTTTGCATRTNWNASSCTSKATR